MSSRRTGQLGNLPPVHQRLIEAMPGLLSKPEYADATLKCGKKEWRVHKLLVRLQSPVLARAFNGSFMEAREGVVDLPDDDPNAIDALVTFIYTGGYSIKQSRPVMSTTLQQHVRAFITADKYNIPSMEDFSAYHFCQNVDPHSYNDDDFRAAIRLLYEEAPDRKRIMHDKVVEFASVRARDTSGRYQLGLLGQRFPQLLDDVPAFATELYSHVLQRCKTKGSGEVRLKCTACEKSFVIDATPFTPNKPCQCPYCSETRNLMQYGLADLQNRSK